MATAKLRVTRELLEYALDLPDGVTIVEVSGPTTLTDGTEVVELVVEGTTDDIEAGGSYALGYAESHHGCVSLTEIVAV